MGQTLTHGVYLPDEGERNCYNGLASNWSILDGAVGTIAEHTTALAGKAPLVHTHTKSDVTDLFNSANTWTGSNQFNTSVKFSGQTGINWARGGTAGTLPSSVMYYGFQNALDSNYNTFDRIRSYVSTTGTNLQEHIKYAWNDLTKYVTINYWINADGSDSEYKLSVKRVIPGSSNATDLGTSTNKWKTLNGVNPGALSLPKGYTEEGANKDYINIASVIQTLDGTAYSYTMPDNGWICVRAEQAQQVHVTLFSWYFGQSVSHSTGSTLIVSVPFRKNDQITLKVKAVTLQYARFYPMQGNV